MTPAQVELYGEMAMKRYEAMYGDNDNGDGSADNGVGGIRQIGADNVHELTGFGLGIKTPEK